MKCFWIAAIIFSSGAAAANRPPACDSQVNPSHLIKLVCASPDAWELDSEATQLGHEAREHSANRDDFDRRDAAWWAKLEACTDSACLVATFTPQVEWLRGVIARSPAVPEAMRTELLTLYNKRFDDLQTSIAVASIVQTCGLRSPMWYGSMARPFDLNKLGAMDQLALTPGERGSVQQHGDLIVRGVYAAYPLNKPATCVSLRGSAMLDDLDRLQRKLTDNYH